MNSLDYFCLWNYFIYWKWFVLYIVEIQQLLPKKKKNTYTFGREIFLFFVLLLLLLFVLISCILLLSFFQYWFAACSFLYAILKPHTKFSLHTIVLYKVQMLAYVIRCTHIFEMLSVSNKTCENTCHLSSGWYYNRRHRRQRCLPPPDKIVDWLEYNGVSLKLSLRLSTIARCGIGFIAWELNNHVIFFSIFFFFFALWTRKHFRLFLYSLFSYLNLNCCSVVFFSAYNEGLKRCRIKLLKERLQLF